MRDCRIEWNATVLQRSKLFSCQNLIYSLIVCFENRRWWLDGFEWYRGKEKSSNINGLRAIPRIYNYLHSESRKFLLWHPLSVDYNKPAAALSLFKFAQKHRCVKHVNSKCIFQNDLRRMPLAVASRLWPRWCSRSNTQFVSGGIDRIKSCSRSDLTWQLEDGEDIGTIRASKVPSEFSVGWIYYQSVNPKYPKACRQ